MFNDAAGWNGNSTAADLASPISVGEKPNKKGSPCGKPFLFYYNEWFDYTISSCACLAEIFFAPLLPAAKASFT